MTSKGLVSINAIADLVRLLVGFATGYTPVQGKDLSEPARKFLGRKREYQSQIIGNREWLVSDQSQLDAESEDMSLKTEQRLALRYAKGADWYRTLANKRLDLAESLRRTFDGLRAFETDLATAAVFAGHRVFFEETFVDVVKAFVQALQTVYEGGCIGTFENVYNVLRQLRLDLAELTKDGRVPKRLEAWLRVRAGKVATAKPTTLAAVTVDDEDDEQDAEAEDALAEVTA